MGVQRLTLQVRSRNAGWHDAATVTYLSGDTVEVEYDLDYAARCLGKADSRALSVSMPVDTMPYRGPLPGFLLDLIPQGEPLRRLLARYSIQGPERYYDLLVKVPLAAPGNLRVKEPWVDLDGIRDRYDHPGFALADIIRHKTEFVDYMELHGAPVGGTSGAGGGSPKFLLRQDARGKFHADGMLGDTKTRRCLLVKFPYTDSRNSRLLSRTEKLYYDLLRALPVITGHAIEIHNDILFLTRFDRVGAADGGLNYLGLESLYGAHNVNAYGARLWHEDNIHLLTRHSSAPREDVVEYLKRDLLNKILGNTDNHGRNTSLLKSEGVVRLSPIYDLTAMKFFTGDFIVEMTRWQAPRSGLKEQVGWIAETTGLSRATLVTEVKALRAALGDVAARLASLGVPQDFIDRAGDDRARALAEMSGLEV